jgi:hypothetical protein
MQQAAVLFGPIVEVRDVLESYLQDGVRVADWRQRLIDASHRFAELGQAADTDPRLVDLSERIAELAGLELETSPLTRALAAEIGDLVDEVRVPGVPRPEDDDWAF